jgi:hypothetical protein
MNIEAKKPRMALKPLIPQRDIGISDGAGRGVEPPRIASDGF